MKNTDKNKKNIKGRNGKGKFEPGNKVASAKKGKKHESTLIKEWIKEQMDKQRLRTPEELGPKAIGVFDYAFENGDLKTQLHAAEKILKYIYPTKIEHQGDGEGRKELRVIMPEGVVLSGNPIKQDDSINK